MEENLTKWRDPSDYRVEGDSIVISDSNDDDLVNDSMKISRIIDESNNFNVMPEVTPKKDMKFSDDDTPIVPPAKNFVKKTKNYNIDSDDSDYEQISNYEEDEKHYLSLHRGGTLIVSPSSQ